MPAPTIKPADFTDVLASMAEVDRLKSREELLALEADMPARVADVSARLKTAYRQQGVNVRDETIAEGVEKFFAQRLVMQLPEPTLATRLAPLWLHRRKIFLSGVLIALLAAVSTAGVYVGVVLPERRAREQQITDARRALDEASRQVHTVASREADELARVQRELAHTTQAVTDREMPKAIALASAGVENRGAAVAEKLRSADQTLARFPADHPLTFEQVPGAQAAARESTDLALAMGHELDEIGSTAQHVAALRAERAGLETAWQRLDHAGLPASLRTNAEPIYAEALATVAAFAPASEVRAASLRLHKLADAEVRLRDMPARIRAVAAQARAISRDPVADQRIAANERIGLAAVDSADIAAADTNLTALQEIATRLSEVFTLRIVNRPREYTRFWRYPNNKPTVKNFYIVVEAFTANGQPLVTTVRSEEDGSTGRVTKWAERVDEATYNRVGRDKQDDGIIQDAVLAEKEKGLLNPTYRMGPKAGGGDLEGGRIYRWEYRG